MGIYLFLLHPLKLEAKNKFLLLVSKLPFPLSRSTFKDSKELVSSTFQEELEEEKEELRDLKLLFLSFSLFFFLFPVPSSLF